MEEKINNEEQISNLEFIKTKGLGPDNAKFFLAREDDLKRIDISLNNLRDGRSDGLRLVAERGAGKSSVFDFLEEIRCAEMSILGVKIDVLNKPKQDVIVEIFDAIRQKAIKNYGLYRFKKHLWGVQKNIRGVSVAGYGVQFAEEAFVQSAKLAIKNHLQDLQPKGVKAVLIMLDDVDDLDVRDLGVLASIFHNIPGCITYLATGKDHFSARQTEKDAPERVTNVESGIAAYWHRIILDPFERNELEKIIEKYTGMIASVMPGDDKNILSFLSRGNGRIAMTLLLNSQRWGEEQTVTGSLLHVTEEVVEKTREELEEGLSGILELQFNRLRETDPTAIKPRWW